MILSHLAEASEREKRVLYRCVERGAYRGPRQRSSWIIGGVRQIWRSREWKAMMRFILVGMCFMLLLLFDCWYCTPPPLNSRYYCTRDTISLLTPLFWSSFVYSSSLIALLLSFHGLPHYTYLSSEYSSHHPASHLIVTQLNILLTSRQNIHPTAQELPPKIWHNPYPLSPRL